MQYYLEYELGIRRSCPPSRAAQYLIVARTRIWRDFHPVTPCYGYMGFFVEAHVSTLFVKLTAVALWPKSLRHDGSLKE